MRCDPSRDVAETLLHGMKISNFGKFGRRAHQSFHELGLGEKLHYMAKSPLCPHVLGL